MTRKTPYPQPSLGKAIRQLRDEREVSLRAFAPEASLSVNTLLHIERGTANPTWETVKRIAAALDVSVSELAKLAEKFEK